MRFARYVLTLVLGAAAATSFSYVNNWTLTFGASGAEASSPVVTTDATTGDVFIAFQQVVGGEERLSVKRLNPSGGEIWTSEQPISVVDGFEPLDMSTNGEFVVITGSQPGTGNAKTEMATVNLRASNGNLVWVHIENTNSLPDFGQQVSIVGDSAYLVGSVGSAFTGIRVRLADGLELWQRTFAGVAGSVGQRVGLVVEPTGDVFIGSTRQSLQGGPSNVVMIRLSQDGQILNERLIAVASEMNAMCQASDGSIVTVGGSPDTFSGQPHIVKWNRLGNAVLTRTFPDLNSRFATVAPAAAPGYVHVGHESGNAGATLISQGMLDSNFNALSGEAPGPGKWGVMQAGLNGDVVSLLSIRNQATGLHFARLIRLPNFDGQNENLSGTDTRGIDLAQDAKFGHHIIAYSRDAAGVKSVGFRSLNAKPVAIADEFQGNENFMMFVDAPGVLGNDIAGAGATAVVVSPPQGLFTLNADGSFSFLPPPGFNGTTSFTYDIVRGSQTSRGTCTLLIQPTIDRVEMDAPAVVGGATATGRVFLTGPRLATTGQVAILEDSAFAAGTPPLCEIPVGASEGTFTMSTAPTRENRLVTVTASFLINKTTQFTIRPPQVSRLVALRPTIIGGAPGRFRVELDGRAPTNGIAVSLSDDSTAILAPSAVAVPAGATSAEFDAPTASVTSSRTANVTATLGTSASATVGIVGCTLSLNPTSVTGGASSTGTIRLTSNAIAQPISFDLTDDSPATGFAANTATIAAGSLSVDFQVITGVVPTDRTSTITATGQGVARTAQLRVLAAALQSVSMNPSSVRGGQSSTGTVRLTGNAPTGGVVVTLQAGAGIVQVPASVTVAAGQNTATFNATTSPVTQTFMVTVAARFNGVTRTTTLILTP